MTTGAGVDLIGGWFGTGPDRGIALVFVLTGLLGLAVTLLALRSRPYRQLSERYTGEPELAPRRLNDLPGSARNSGVDQGALSCDCVGILVVKPDTTGTEVAKLD
jgi:hypothetical protein